MIFPLINLVLLILNCIIFYKLGYVRGVIHTYDHEVKDAMDGWKASIDLLVEIKEASEKAHEKIQA